MKKLLFIFFGVMSGTVFGQSETGVLDVKQDSITLEIEPSLTIEKIVKFNAYQRYFDKESPVFNMDQTKSLNIDGSENYIDEQEKSLVPDDQEFIMGPNRFDSRFEIRNLNPLIENNISIINNSESVGCLIDAGQLVYVGDSTYSLDLSQIFGKTYRLCPDEPYYSQPTVGFGTAFFIDNDKIITALHCFDNKNIKDVYFVLGYVLANIDGTINPEFSGGQVFKIKKIIRKIVDYDIVILQLDKPYRRFFPPIARNYEYKLKTPIYALGYPVGLPLKLATNASIKSKPDNLFIYTTLDTYQGNSGSPVFDKSTNEIIGILLEGGVDFVNQGNCNRSFLCARSDCLGEKVLMLSNIAEEIFGE